MRRATEAEDRAERRRVAESLLMADGAAFESPGDDGAPLGRLAASPPLYAHTDPDLLALLRSGWPAAASPDTNVLLAAMACAHPSELPPPPPFADVPPWLRAGWLDFLMRQPLLSRHPGELDRHVDTLDAVIDRVHEATVRTPLPEARDLAERFSRAADPLLKAYFTHRNLRDMFRKRAEILEFLAIKAGLPLAHLFPPGTGARFRVGLLLNDLLPGTETFYAFAHLSTSLSAACETFLFLLNHDIDPGLFEKARSLGVSVAVLPAAPPAIVAECLRRSELDVLLIATNCTLRPQAAFVAMHRLARVQVVGAASPVSPGFTQGDVFLLGDGNATAEDAQSQYTERLFLVPGLCTYYDFRLGDKPPTVSAGRGQLGVTPDTAVFVSAANFFKITPELADLWARILRREPRSILVLMPFNPNWSETYEGKALQDLLKDRLLAHDVDLRRLRIVERVPERSDVQRVLALADVYLDSHPFAGACSMIDPLEVGLPVVVRDAATFRGGIAAAMLRELGLGDMVAGDDDAYVETAVRLARDPALRAEWRRRVRTAAGPVLPFLDTAAYARRFADACDALVREDRAGMARHLADPDRTRAGVAALVRRLEARRSPWLQQLTDTNLVRLLLLPYFRSLDDAGRERVLIDVGACVGAFAEPFLAAGWRAHLLEPDPACCAAMDRLVRAFPGRVRHHAAAAVDGPAERIAFHRSAVGLSGLGPSPYADTEDVLAVPAVRLAELVRREGLASVDLLKVDAEGFDFRVLAGYDFAAARPRLVMVEFGDMYPGQDRQSILDGIAAMRRHGYDCVIFNGEDDGNFGKRIWEYRVFAVSFAAPCRNAAGRMLGNILFFPQGEALLPALLLRLVESFLPGSERSAAAGTADAEPHAEAL